MLGVRGLSVRMGSLEVIEGFSLDVPRGSFVSLVGLSGCGKTTLFNALTGLCGSEGGQIVYGGRVVDDLNGCCALMGQKDLLLPWLTLMENAVLPLSEGGEVSMEEVRGLFEVVGLGGFEGFLPGQVSGGMRQRTALVRTLAFGKDLVLMDEPLSSLDAITRGQMQSLLLDLQLRFGKTILMITHDVEEAVLLSDRVVVLSRMPMRVVSCYEVGGDKPRRRDSVDVVRLRGVILDELEGL